MKRLTLTLTAALLAAFSFQACARSLNYTPTGESQLRSDCPQGTCDVGGDPGASWTVTEIGDSTAVDVDITGTTSGTIDITLTGSGNEADGLVLVYKSKTNSNAVELTYTVTLDDPGVVDHRVAGCFTADALALDSDIHLAGHWLNVPRHRSKKFVGEAGETVESGVSGYDVDTYGACSYDGTDELQHFDSSDGMTWNNMGVALTDTPASTYYYGFAFQGSDLGVGARIVLDYTETATPSISGSNPTPPSGSDEESEYTDLVSGVTLDGGRNDVNVSTGAGYASAVNGASCGDNIILADGTYNNAATLNTNCPATNPVKIYGASLWGADITQPLTVDAPSAYAIIGGPNAGLKFSGAGQVVIEGYNNKVIGNLCEGITGHSCFYIRNSINSPSDDFAPEIAYNTIRSPASGCGPRSDESKRFFWDQISNSNSASGMRDTWIHHNHIESWETACEQGDLIDGGSSGNASWVHTAPTNLRFEFNLIEGFRNIAPATHGVVMDWKLREATVRGNTVRNITQPGQSRMQQRHANRGRFIRNHSDGWLGPMRNTGGIVACNVAPQIQIAAGNCAPDAVTNGQCASQDWQVSSNSGTLIVGHEYGSFPTAADGTLIEDHTGSITCDNETNTDGACGDAANATPTYTCDLATELDDSEVGHQGLLNAASSYNTPRGF